MNKNITAFTMWEAVVCLCLVSFCAISINLFLLKMLHAMRDLEAHSQIFMVAKNIAACEQMQIEQDVKQNCIEQAMCLLTANNIIAKYEVDQNRIIIIWKDQKYFLEIAGITQD